MPAQKAVLQFTGGALPENPCFKSWQDVFDAFVERLIAQFNSETATFVTGSVQPTEDMGPWFKNGTDIWVWDDTIGSYRPLALSSVTGQVPVATCVPWAGTIAAAPSWFNVNGAQWMHADGSNVNRVTFADLFSIIGTQYGAGDGTTTFGLPDTKDIMLAGASMDDSGTAKTAIGNGITLLKNRAYLDHYHIRQIPGSGDGEISQGAVSPYSISKPKDTNAESVAIDLRVLPPYLAMPFIIRVK